ncbi:MAG TPA: hypothetical protein O0X42_02085 [Methanocorpusculum sp.]|nr:hypothetical protein [Methanocorpusculum sp.]
MAVTAAELEKYRAIKNKNTELVVKFAKKHGIDEKEILENIKYCLYENIKPDKICDKTLLKGKKEELYHYHFKQVCVIIYTIIYIGKCYVPKIRKIETEEKAHKLYKRS